MGVIETVKRNKGGRPKKAARRSAYIGVKCTLLEKTIIRQKAKLARVTAAELLRSLGLSRNIVRPRSLPKEVLEMKTTLLHLAANTNQLAKKKNYNEPFNAMERVELFQTMESVKKVVDHLTNYLS